MFRGHTVAKRIGWASAARTKKTDDGQADLGGRLGKDGPGPASQPSLPRPERRCPSTSRQPPEASAVTLGSRARWTTSTISLTTRAITPMATTPPIATGVLRAWKPVRKIVELRPGMTHRPGPDRGKSPLDDHEAAECIRQARRHPADGRKQGGPSGVPPADHARGKPLGAGGVRIGRVGRAGHCRRHDQDHLAGRGEGQGEQGNRQEPDQIDDPGKQPEAPPGTDDCCEQHRRPQPAEPSVPPQAHGAGDPDHGDAGNE